MSWRECVIQGEGEERTERRGGRERGEGGELGRREGMERRGGGRRNEGTSERGNGE